MVDPEVAVDFDAGPLDVPSSFTVLTSRTLAVKRGRSHELDLTQSSRLASRLDNRTRDLDPDNADSPHHPNVTPMRYARARATLDAVTYDLCTVLVEDWGQIWPGSVDAVVELQAADAFKLLNLAKVAGTRYTHQLYTDAVDDVVVGANAAHYYLDDLSGASVLDDRLGFNFDLTPGTNVTIGDPARPPTYGRPRSVLLGPVNDAGDGLSRATGPGFAAALPQTFAWSAWLRLDTLSTDGYIVGVKTSGVGSPRVTWKMNAAGAGIVAYSDGFAVARAHTLADVFLADGEWHHYAVRVTLANSPSELLVGFVRDGVSLGAGTPSGAGTTRALGAITSLFAGGDGGDGGSHGLDGNMAQLLLIHNNAPSATALEELGSPVFDYIPQEPAGLQIHAFLDSIGWPESLRAIDDGTVDMVALSPGPGDPVLSTLLKIAETSERGFLFVDGSGVITFQDAATLAARTLQATYGDSVAELRYHDLQTRHDDEDIRNQIAVTYAGGTVYVEDAVSVHDKGPRLFPVEVSLAETADVEAYAADLLAAYKDPHTRPVQLKLVVKDDTTALEQVLARQPGDIICVIKRPPGGGDPLILDAVIEGLTLEQHRGGIWYATWDLAPYDFSPVNVAGLELWLAADDITGLADGAAVTTWADSSPNGKDAMQATAGNKPTYQTAELNGLPVVRFDGSDFMETTAFAAELTSSTIFFVAKLAAIDPAQFYIDGLISTKRHAITVQTNDKWAIGSGGVNVEGAVVGNTAWHVLAAVFNSAANDALFVDGASYASGNSGSNAMDGATIGARYDLTSPINGDVAEVIIYDRALSDTERTRIEAYLRTKWGL